MSAPGASSGAPFGSPNPHRLYRNPAQGRIFGVCAGIADFLGIDPLVVRIAAVIGLVFFFMPTLGAYLLASLVLKPKPPALYGSRDEEEFWRTVATKPDRTLAGLRHKFGDLERRLRDLEAHVASPEFTLNQAIRDLDRRDAGDRFRNGR
jgi:phage shock protein C